MVNGSPHELFAGVGVGTTCASLIQATVDPPADGTEKVCGEIVYVYTHGAEFPVTGSVYVNVYVLDPEQGGSALTTGPVIVKGMPQELFHGGGTGVTWASLTQGTMEPSSGGGMKVGGSIMILAEAVVVHPLKSVTVTVYVPAKSPVKSSVVAELLHK
jgi:hypothetical protein